MSAPTHYLVPPTLQRADKLPHGTCVDCKSVVNIGVFFDGTDNNFERDKEKSGHSNVARLFLAYKNDYKNGHFSHYVAGIGTEFNLISESKPSFRGSPWGAGGEARIVFGLLQVLNSLHAFVNGNRRMFDGECVKALAGDRTVAETNPDQWPPAALTEEDKLLTALDLPSGLVGNATLRHAFLAKHAGKLGMQLARKETTPNVSGVYLDVFGFSRGAAEARVFCTWLYESLLKDGKLCGVPAYVRFLGLFDTVASVGLSVTGHNSWATTQNLRIHRAVKSCVHYVALHEFRNNFPLDSVCVDGVVPSNCCEQLALGSHSDVGGGYEPGSQGKGVVLQASDPRTPEKLTATRAGGDKYKLSQLPLNLMLAAARKAREAHGTDGDPWLDFKSDEGDQKNLTTEFACAPETQVAVQRYFAGCGVAPGVSVDQAFREHMTLYVAWRVAVTLQKNGFQSLPSAQYAQTTDDLHSFYKQGQDMFAEQMKAIDGMTGMLRKPTEDDFKERKYHGKAGEIHRRAKAMTVAADIGLFFDQYVHDSYAGFISKFGDGFFMGTAHGIAEPRRYFCYRLMYQGDDRQLNVMLQQPQPAQEYA
ncbi:MULTISPECIES: T6SS phospholipase effector Tle1-like catalytic domain-containing protein [unclassified Janthinobacterium]|uniref:T6SS phospholipase effector Tle1-like catalytic domain-containing protein n=1 Tax=unclassified Janthinobacterium TaxID=2610881 RepID=UPI000346B3B3|nr:MULTISPECIES: DUF2235 domain-containing protein [unclassified Janthinobacterium]MEC5159140.1 uncharacterized protein (DUF2235 family) [Janthinobacterium sp. CG_S6]